jgi:hypothetical protein
MVACGCRGPRTTDWASACDLTVAYCARKAAIVGDWIAAASAALPDDSYR